MHITGAPTSLYLFPFSTVQSVDCASHLCNKILLYHTDDIEENIGSLHRSPCIAPL